MRLPPPGISFPFIICHLLVQRKLSPPSGSPSTTSLFVNRIPNNLSIMRLPQSRADAATLLTLLFPLLSAADGSFDCSRLVKDKVNFDFSSLSGARSVMISDASKSASYLNTTYTIDICRPLKRVSEDKVPKAEQCPHGTRGKHDFLCSCTMRRICADIRAQFAQSNVISKKTAQMIRS